jgi:hypothetical protein
MDKLKSIKEMISKREPFINNDSILCEKEWNIMLQEIVLNLCLTRDPDTIEWNKTDFIQFRKSSRGKPGLVLTFGNVKAKTFGINCNIFPLDAIKLKNKFYGNRFKHKLTPIFNITGQHKKVLNLLKYVILKSIENLKAILIYTKYLKKDLKEYVIFNVKKLTWSKSIVIYTDNIYYNDFRLFIN